MGLLITGAGTVGVQVARTAVERNIKNVVLFDIAPNKAFIRSVVPQPFQVEQGSLLDMPRLCELISKYNIDRIIHTAVVPETCPNIYETVSTNVMGTTNLFEVSRLFGVERMINCSSAGLYDFTKQRPDSPPTELWPVSVKDEVPYYSTKIAVEAIARNYVAKFGVDIITTRLGGNFGPSPSYNMGDKKWMYELVRDAFNDGVIRRDKAATRNLPWCYARDTAGCLLEVAYSKNKATQPIYNCSYPGLYSLHEILAALKTLIPGLKVQIDEILDIGWKFPYDSSCITRDFGYKFTYGPNEALSDYLGWMREAAVHDDKLV